MLFSAFSSHLLPSLWLTPATERKWSLGELQVDSALTVYDVTWHARQPVLVSPPCEKKPACNHNLRLWVVSWLHFAHVK